MINFFYYFSVFYMRLFISIDNYLYIDKPNMIRLYISEKNLRYYKF